MSDYHDKLTFETDHVTDLVGADRELAAFLLSYLRRNAGSSDGETAPPKPAEHDPKEIESER